MNNWLGSTARRLACRRCGTAFSCTGTEACWCAEESVRLPMPRAGEDCLCRDCLRKAAEAQTDAATRTTSPE
ncbi:MAG TPA: hypothetical protein VMM15_25155 [Bradyrhizobium sp.]|nr:hypothetical protein [Bradyrhizobium sp.]